MSTTQRSSAEPPQAEARKAEIDEITNCLPDLSCGRCDYRPCACEYIARLRPSGDLARLRAIAAEQARLPFPHHAACVCPSCFSLRLGSWSAGRPAAAAVLIRGGPGTNAAEPPNRRRTQW